jgi:hypothetical protein
MEQEQAVTSRKMPKPFDTRFEQWVIKQISFPEKSARAGCLTLLTVIIGTFWAVLPLFVPSTKPVLTFIGGCYFALGLLASIYIGIRYSYFLLRFRWSWKGRSIFGGAAFLVVAAIAVPILIFTHR